MKNIDYSDRSGFYKYFSKIIENLKALEQQKHLKPKFSQYCAELAEFVNSSSHNITEIPKYQDNFSKSSMNNDAEFQIMSDGLVFDESRVHRFTPNHLEIVIEKPKSKNMSRERTEKLFTSKNHSPDYLIRKLTVKSNKKRAKYSMNYQNRALNKINDIF